MIIDQRQLNLWESGVVDDGVVTVSKDDYYIDRIAPSLAQDICIRKHYLHRKSPCSHSFGLFNRATESIVGVVIYGTPAASGLRKGICGPDHAFNVLELTRLWVEDGVPKNAASMLVGGTLKLLDKEIVVSFADTSVGHVGYVYQATNWIYTGLSAKRTNWHIDGVDVHNHTLTDKYSSAELRSMYGDRFKLVERPRKHRYIYFACNKRRRKQLMKELRYPVMPYPKGDTLRVHSTT